MAGITGVGLNVGGGNILFEILTGSVDHEVDGVEAEAGAKDGFGAEIPGESEAGLEVIEITFGEVALAVYDGPFEAGEGVCGIGNELRLLTELGGEGGLIAPAEAEFEGEIAAGSPGGLGVERLDPPAGQPSGAILLEDSLTDGAEEEAG